MKYLKELKFENIEQILWLDVETVTEQAEINEESPFWDAWEHKVKYDESVQTTDDAITRYRERGGLFKEFSKIISVSYGRVVNGVLKVKNLSNMPEKQIIETLFNDVTLFSNAGIKFLGVFSGKQFDIPFVLYRAVVNQVPIIPSFDTAGLSPWNIKHIIDVQDILRGGSITNLSLDGVCASFGIQSPKILNKSVRDVYYEDNDIELIAKYNSEDVLATCNAFCHYLMIPKVEMEVISNINIKQKEQNVLEKLYDTKNLSNEVKTLIKDLADKNKLTKKDKVSLEKIVLAHYLSKEDKADLKKEKTLEVKQFIENL